MVRTWDYKGYSGEYEVCFETRVCVGKVTGIKDIVIFESENKEGVQKAFEESVDDYLETLKEIGR